MTATVTSQGDVAIITMDDGKANAISHTMLDALEPAFDEAEAAKAVVIAGREGKFCAGFDLSVMQGATADEVMALVNRGGKLAHRMYGYSRPLVAAATGHGIAMGGFMLLASDTRIGVDTGAKFGLNETAIGMVMPPFGLILGKDRLNRAQRTAAFIQAQIYDSAGAITAGFLDALAPASDVVAKAVEAATALANLPAHSYAGNKTLIRQPALDAIAASLP